MDKEQLEQRIQELMGALEKSAANHHAIMGRLDEAKFMLGNIIGDVITQVIEPTVENVILPDLESVVEKDAVADITDLAAS